MIISIVLIVCPEQGAAQIACPSMAITQPQRGPARPQSGFSGKAPNKRSGRLDDYFSRKKRPNPALDLKAGFASRSGKKGRFRSFDEFATRRKRTQRYREFDEFAYRSSNRNGKVNDHSQFYTRAVPKGFRKPRPGNKGGKGHQRRDRNRQEYTPFASSLSPYAAPSSHRDPQMGLWGGSIGRWSGKDSRPMIPLPEPEEKKDD